MWWKLLAGAIGLALAAFLITQYGKARENAGILAERVKWKDATIENEKRMAALALANEQHQAAALNSYMDRMALIEPVVVRSRDTVTRYAQTTAGSAPCLAADRVLGIEQTRGELFADYTLTAGPGAAALPADHAGDR